ncbi:MAG: restriction endonuclease subunit S [Geoalkalibacter sp.]|uniref:restriction endonuclease subunit S n=1 Tax=Geoalkalibacter sp. TaxID=3041440 RepID=UPI003D0A3F8C
MSPYRPYPSYKESDIEWLGRVPSHWHVKRLKDVALCRNSNVDKKSYEGEQPVELCNYTDVYYNEKITDSINFMRATAKREDILRFSLKSGDVIITKDSESADDIGIPALVTESASGVVCGYHLTLIRPQEVMLGNYLFRVLCSFPSSTQFYLGASGVTRYGLGKGAIEGLLLSAPPIEEQQAIATFLDRETARIDALIEKKQRQIELLKEKRQAIITQAVTKGLDPNVPMKDSGVEWLGEVPEHWEVGKLRWLAKLQGGIAKGRDVTGKDAVTLPYLRVANVQDGYVDLENVKEISLLKSEVQRYLLAEKDVLMNEGGDNDKLGRGTVWKGQISPCIHQNHVFSVRTERRLIPEWLALYTRSTSAKAHFYLRSKQSTNLASISASNIMDITVPVPPPQEQEAVLKYVNDTIGGLGAIGKKTERSIQLLQERRSALITAAVTGQIDVREEV